MTRKLAIAACALTVCVTAASAFIRHWQAGSDCGDAAQCAALAASLSDQAPLPVLAARVLHRVTAMLVGLCALWIALVGWSRLDAGERVAAAVALALTGGLAWLGRYTPSGLPLVTLANVVGGFALAAAFAWIAARGVPPACEVASARAPPEEGPAAGGAAGAGTAAARTRAWAWLALALLGAQASLGVMIMVRGAIGACPAVVCALPSAIDPALFDPRVAHAAPQGLQALHLAHRGAAIGFAVIAAFAAARQLGGATAGRARVAAWMVLGLLALQIVLGATLAGGVSGVAGGAAHNATAALLAVALTALARRADA
jgi:heme A synthase